jgi:Family of unknown function (DUF6503)
MKLETMKTFLRSLLSIVFLAWQPVVFGQLEQCLEAHGGLAKWRSYGGVEYNQSWTSPKGSRKDHQVFNLETRDGLIASDTYTVGASKGEVWVKPDLKALGGMPPRFYMWTPFYFFGMPFVFADPGAVQSSSGKKMFQGREYDVVKITFEKGTGDTPEDNYVLYIDPKSHQLKLASYIVTYPAMRKGKPINELKRHAIVFQEWQEADGLLVPKLAPFYAWTGEDIEGEPLGTVQFSDVHFSREAPDGSRFAKPADAVAAPLR